VRVLRVLHGARVVNADDQFIGLNAAHLGG
jgi:hypothetical protein